MSTTLEHHLMDLFSYLNSVAIEEAMSNQSSPPIFDDNVRKGICTALRVCHPNWNLNIKYITTAAQPHWL
jgi:hypothetical protein